MNATTLQPIAGTERMELLDVLRGFALLGILFSNFDGAEGSLMPSVDALVSSAFAAFVSESFYPLYSFLFGLGFAVQLARARSRGTGITRLYVRRMLILFVIGTVHSVFIWEGDILVRYAIAGLVLIPLHRLPQKVVLGVAALLLISILNGDTLRALSETSQSSESSQALSVTDDALDRPGAHQAALVREGRDSSYVAMIVAGAKDWWYNVQQHGHWLTWALNDVLFCILIGFIVGRARLLHEASERTRTLVIVGATGFVAAAVGIPSMATLELQPGLLRTTMRYCENFGMTALYISAIALMVTRSPSMRSVLRVFAAPGRMGLTNYLAQSLVMTWFSMPYGFGLQPSTTMWALLNLAFFFGTQVPLSRWWLMRYNYGPAEWLWRSATYGALQPMRLRFAATVQSPASTRPSFAGRN